MRVKPQAMARWESRECSETSMQPQPVPATGARLHTNGARLHTRRRFSAGGSTAALCPAAALGPTAALCPAAAQTPATCVSIDSVSGATASSLAGHGTVISLAPTSPPLLMKHLLQGEGGGAAEWQNSRRWLLEPEPEPRDE